MERSNYEVHENDMLYKKKILFKAKSLIKDFLILSNGTVVLVSNNELTGDRNIYYYDFDGQLKWQVATPDNIYPTNFYTSIYLSDDGSLQAYSKNGVEYTLSEDDGSIIKGELIK